MTGSTPPPDGPGPGRLRQAAIYAAGAYGRRPAVPTDFTTLERMAQRRASRRGWAYVAGGAGEGATMRANRAAFERRRIVPRVLRDVSRRDLSIELFGRRLPAPLLLGPIGAAEVVHREADEAIARAAAALGLPYVFSSQACASMEACAAQMGQAPRWFQLYWSTDEGLVDSFLHRAQACGADAVVVTLDTTLLGWRPRDLNLGSLPFARGEGIAQYVHDPRFREMVAERLRAGARSAADAAQARPTPAALATLVSMARHFPGSTLANLRSPEPRAAVETFLATYSRPSLSWADLATLRERTRLPILLKGILHPDDARRAVDAGMDGIVVSNHGGRQVDGAIAALDALAQIAPAVAGRTTILFDSGIRSGADVFRALAVGADAVLVGRPYLYGLTLAGSDGVRAVMENILAEFDLTLGLSGLTRVAEIDGDALHVTD